MINDNSPIAERMLAQDTFSQWLGVELLEYKEGYCKIAMTIRKDMLNGMGKAHGGIAFSFADSCFGFATNAHGRHAVSIESSVNHIKGLDAGDRITAETMLDHPTNKLGFHVVEVKRGEELVALFKGVVYRTSKTW